MLNLLSFISDSHLIGLDFMVYLLYADLPCAHITTLGAQVLHPGEGELPEVAMLHARAHQWHRDISV